MSDAMEQIEDTRRLITKSREVWHDLQQLYAQRRQLNANIKSLRDHLEELEEDLTLQLAMAGGDVYAVMGEQGPL